MLYEIPNFHSDQRGKNWAILTIVPPSYWFSWVEDKIHRRKMAREAARSVLPNATETKIVVSGNVRAWRTMLGALEAAPDSVATTLDWAIKLALFKQRARERGLVGGCRESGQGHRRDEIRRFQPDRSVGCGH